MPDPEDLQLAEEQDTDSMERVTPIRRVETIGTTLTPIHREPPAPPSPKPARKAVELVLKPFTPVSKTQSMRTMSDLTDMSRPVRESEVSRVKGRHVAVSVVPPASILEEKK